jgi:hypothetical protein
MGKQRAFLTFDVIAAVGITLIAVLAFTLAVRQFAQARRYNDARRILTLTAETELNCIRAGVAAHTNANGPTPARPLPPGVTLRRTTAPAAGVWNGFDRVTVIAHKRITARRSVRVELSAYIPEIEP